MGPLIGGIMSEMRSSRLKWSAAEDKTLREQWTNGRPIRMWLDLLPGRSERGIVQRAGKLKLAPRGSGCASGNSPSWRLIRQVLEAGAPLTPIEISKRTGVTRQHVYEELRQHHPADIHIAGYAERGPTGYRAKLWKLGAGKDAPRPQPMTKKEINKRRYQRFKKNPEALARRDAKKRLRDCEKEGKLIRRDQAAAWIGGPAC